MLILPSSLLLWKKPPDNTTLTSSFSVTEKKISSRTLTTDQGLKEAAKTRVFWVLSITTMIHFMVTQAVSLHIMPYSLSRNLSIEVAALMATLFPLVTVIGRLSAGWLVNRFGYTAIIVTSLILQTIAMGLLYLGFSIPYFIGYLVLSGPSFGCMLVLRPLMVREYFGMKFFGTIQGFIVGIVTIGGIIGPSFAGWIFDSTGGYQTAWFILGAISLLSICIPAFMRTTESKRG